MISYDGVFRYLHGSDMGRRGNIYTNSFSANPQMEELFEKILSNMNLLIKEVNDSYPPVGIINRLVDPSDPILNEKPNKNFIGVMVEYIFISMGYTKGREIDIRSSITPKRIEKGMTYQ